MSEHTAISWCDSTFNPWIGCQKVSPACDHCYAERLMDHRMHKVQWGAGQQRKRTSAANWRQPMQWNAKRFMQCEDCGWRGEAECAVVGCGVCGSIELSDTRRRVFCASLADVFDNEVPHQWRVDLFTLIADTPHLDWLLLTKRIGNAKGDMLPPLHWPWPNVWLGATICNQEEADRDIPKLLATPAAVRFLSVEPMLGPVDLSTHRGAKGLPIYWEGTDADGLMPVHCGLTGRHLGDFARRGWVKTSENMSPWLDWVICGGESGPHARPGDVEWYRSLMQQCKSAGVPFHLKQITERGRPIPMEQWPADLRVQEFAHG